MKWPWVSRERYEQVCRYHQIQVQYTGDHARRVIEERERYGELLERYHALVRDIVAGSAPEAPARTPDDVAPKRERSVVSQTIKEEANGNPKVAAWLQKRARELRAENKSPDEIATELRRWQSTEDVKE